jgi:CRP/FNR family transcriptional regulator, cyclic AMP receptor protein
MKTLWSRSETETWHLDESVAGPVIRATHLGRRRKYKTGEYLYRQGETSSLFYFVLRGHVQISASREDGAEFVLEVMGRWAVCGEGAAFDGRARFSSAKALEESEAVVFDAATLKDSFHAHPDLAVALLAIMSIKQRVLGIRALYLSSPRPEARIAELLRRLVDLYGRPDGATTVVNINLTHEQMAAMTGTTRVTVTRVLKRLRLDGALQLKGRQLRILDQSRLQA